MNEQPFFSIVIPTYNREDQLAITLNSILAQTFGDFECIVVDDGSKNSSKIRTVVENIGDERFSYHHQENGGACKARNTGIMLAQGKFIALLDSDDQFERDKLNYFYELLNNWDCKKDIFCYSQLYVDRGTTKKWIKPSRGIKTGERMDEYLMCTHGWAQTSTQVLNSALAKKVLFNVELPSSQDTDFAIRCWSEGANIQFVDKPLITMNDIYDPNRVSKQGNYKSLLTWLEHSRGSLLSEKAYWGYRGWEIARISSYESRVTGLRYFLNALLRKPYSIKMSILIFNQIAIPQVLYQKIAAKVVEHFGRV